MSRSPQYPRNTVVLTAVARANAERSRWSQEAAFLFKTIAITNQDAVAGKTKVVRF